MDTANGPILRLRSVTHRFGDVTVLDDVSFDVAAGEFLTLLGPSGSGKTTLLRIIGGLEHADDVERLDLDGRDIRDLPANQRNVVTVFQHYALFPHMSVGENVEYGLHLRRVPAAERRRQAEDMLAMVRLPDKYGRRIHQLSGGERQRVALARALVLRPAVLLLDEPLGALDEKLRVEMQTELLQLQRRLKTTFIYVTHSQEEALTMSDRIVLLNHGRIAQAGPPRSLYEQPCQRFVAEFMGIENVVEGRITAAVDKAVTLDVHGTEIRGRWTGAMRPAVDETAFAAIRAQSVCLADRFVRDGTCLESRTLQIIYRGKYQDLLVESSIGRLAARISDHTDNPGSPCYVWWRDADCVVGPMC